MDLAVATSTPPGLAPSAPISPHTANGADVIARAKTGRNISAPTPTTLAQQGAVTKSSMPAIAVPIGPNAARAPERVLKPYGVAMLPEGPAVSRLKPDSTPLVADT